MAEVVEDDTMYEGMSCTAISVRDYEITKHKGKTVAFYHVEGVVSGKGDFHAVKRYNDFRELHVKVTFLPLVTLTKSLLK